MTDSHQLWMPRIGQGRGGPIRAGICRALDQMWPPVMNETLPPRMKAAIEALSEQEPVTSEDQRPGSAR